MAKYTNWISATIDIDGTVEYSGMDVDQTSSLIALPYPCSLLIIQVPTIDSATVGLLVVADGNSNNPAAEVPVAMHYQKSDDSTAAWATTAGTGSYSITVPIVGYQYLRIKVNANQTADRTFKVRGVRL